MAELSKISYDSLIAQIEKARKKRRFETNVSAGEMEYIRKKSVSQSLLKLVVENPSYFPKIREKIKLEYFEEEIHRKIYEIFCQLTDKGVKADVTMVLERLEPAEVRAASEIFMEREPFIDFHIYLDGLLKKSENRAEPMVFSDDDRDDMMKLLEYTKKLKAKNEKNTEENS